MHRVFFSTARAGLPRMSLRGLPLALAALLALTASACMAPSAKQSSAAGPAGEQTARAGPGSQSGAGGEKEQGKPSSWWQRMTRSHKEPKEKPWIYGDVRKGKGLLGDSEHGYTLYRKGEADGSSGPSKPAKVRR